MPGLFELLLLPPQALIHKVEKPRTTIRLSRRRLRGRDPPRKMIPNKPGSNSAKKMPPVRPKGGRSCAVGAVVPRLRVTAVWVTDTPPAGLNKWEISAVVGMPETEYVTGRAVAAAEPLPVINPLLLLTVIEIDAVPPGETGKVLAVDDREKVSVVAVTVRLTVVLTFDGLVGVMVMVCAPVGSAMLARVEMVSVVVTGLMPSKITLVGLKLQVDPAGWPLQLLGLKFTTVGVEPAIAVMVTVDATDCPAETDTGVGAGEN